MGTSTRLIVVATFVALLAPPAHTREAVNDGVVQTRWPNGTLRTEATSRDGVYEGTYRSWYKSGRPYELRHYAKGHEEGLQQAWSEAGALYINYEARNGRHFGTLNSTPCLPVEDGKPSLPFYDTPEFTPRWERVQHQIGPFSLVTQTGTEVSEANLDGRIHVASFIYTGCAAVCPILVSQLSRVQRAVESMADVLIVSYTVTPDADTPSVLADFGKKRHIDPAKWWLLTGSREQIYGLARQSYFADDARVRGANDFLHTERIVLVDGERRLRGVYNGTQPFEIDQLIADIGQLRRGN